VVSETHKDSGDFRCFSGLMLQWSDCWRKDVQSNTTGLRYDLLLRDNRGLESEKTTSSFADLLNSRAMEVVSDMCLQVRCSYSENI